MSFLTGKIVAITSQSCPTSQITPRKPFNGNGPMDSWRTGHEANEPFQLSSAFAFHDPVIRRPTAQARLPGIPSSSLMASRPSGLVLASSRQPCGPLDSLFLVSWCPHKSHSPHVERRIFHQRRRNLHGQNPALHAWTIDSPFLDQHSTSLPAFAFRRWPWN